MSGLIVRISCLLYGLIGAANLQAQAQDSVVEVGTLILIGATTTEITIAADTRATIQQNGNQTNVPTKIVQVGKFAACVVHGASGIGVGSSRIDAIHLLGEWAATHPQGTASEAHKFMAMRLRKGLKAYYEEHRGQHSLVDTKFSVDCVGFERGLPTFYDLTFWESEHNAGFEPNDLSAKPNPRILSADSFIPLGEAQVCQELLKGNNPLLGKYRKRPAVTTFRANLKALDTSDLVDLSRVCLEATESSQGRKVDSYANLVGPPNKYAIISVMSGFRWVNEKAN